MFSSLRYLNWVGILCPEKREKASFLQQELAVELCLGGLLGYMASGLPHCSQQSLWVGISVLHATGRGNAGYGIVS